MARIEESTRIIGEIIMEVSRDVFVADAAGELTGAPPATESTFISGDYLVYLVLHEHRDWSVCTYQP